MLDFQLGDHCLSGRFFSDFLLGLANGSTTVEVWSTLLELLSSLSSSLSTVCWFFVSISRLSGWTLPVTCLVFSFIFFSLLNPLAVHCMLVVCLNNFYGCHLAEFFVLAILYFGVEIGHSKRQISDPFFQCFIFLFQQ